MFTICKNSYHKSLHKSYRKGPVALLAENNTNIHVMAVVSENLAEFSFSSGTQLPWKEIWVFSGFWKDKKLLQAETDPSFSTLSRIFCSMLVSTGILARFCTWVAAESLFPISSSIRSITLVVPSTSFSASSFVPKSNICWTTAFIYPFSLVRREASLTSDARGNTFFKRSNFSSLLEWLERTKPSAL